MTLIPSKDKSSEIENAISEIRHEALPDLLGGSANNHYHLTGAELLKLQNMPAQGIQGEKGDKGDKGDPFTFSDFTSAQLEALKGQNGQDGKDGQNGKAATITIGTVTTGVPGSNAAVTNSGTNTDAILNFTIPRGDKGENGSASSGTAATVNVGTVTTGAAGTNASVTNSGTGTNAVLNFVIPRGETGIAGAKGADGKAATVRVGTVITGEAGSQASVTNSGTVTDAVLNFVIPKGDKGEASETGGSSNTGNFHLVIKKFENNFMNIDFTETFTVPSGVNEIYVSGCGGGGGMTYSIRWDAFTAGANGAYVIDQKINVVQGDVLSITVGAGGSGANNTNTTVIGTKGGNTIIKKNNIEMIRLLGGNGGMEGVNAANFTGQSAYDNLEAWGFDTGYCNGFGSGELSSKVKYALTIWPTPLFPFGIGGTLNMNAQSPSGNIGQGSPGIVFFKYIQVK